FLDHFHKISFQIPVLDPIIVTIAYQQQRSALTGVQSYPVASLKFTFFLPRAAERLYEFPIFVELQYVICPVTVRHENRTIRRYRYSAGIKPIGVFIDARFLGIFNRPLLLALK